jgi:tetratricopeptide (TPR) repeat protein
VLNTLFKPFFPGKKKPPEPAVRPSEPADDLRSPIEACRARVALEPHSADAWLALAKALHRAGEEREAAAAYHNALDRGAPASGIHLQLGVLYAALSEHASAIEHLEKTTDLEPGNADALCMLGTVMSDLGRLEEAAGSFERALDLRADFSEAHFNLGLVRFERSDFQGALSSIGRSAALKRGETWHGDLTARLGRESAPPLEPRDMAVNEVKLGHDCEQLEHLLQARALPAGYREVAEDYRALLEEIRGKVDVESVIPFDAGRHPLVARTYKRPIHVDDTPAPAGALVNPALDFRVIEERYLEARPNIVTVDDLLTPTALQSLRRFCLDSTIWNNIKPGYLGAYFYDGFCSELLLRLAWELRERLPRVIRGLPLQMMWGYKCDSTLPGLGAHADSAAVNVNFWITGDEANLDPEHGGLLVYTHDAPKDWGFAKYNKDSATILGYLDSVGSVPVRVPYRANRAVVFDSDLFHASDRPHFREGYLNRRINVTLLYGLRSM